MSNNQKNSNNWNMLMAAAQDGDNASYLKLLREITPALQAFIRKRLFDESLVDDVVQEILMAIHKVRHTYDPNQPFHSWMYAIAHHKMVDSIRKTTRKQHVEGVELCSVETFVHDNSNTESSVSAKIDIESLLVQLPEKQRRIVTMMKLEEKSVADVAQSMDMSTAAVKVTAHRAYKKLKQILIGMTISK